VVDDRLDKQIRRDDQSDDRSGLRRDVHRMPKRGGIRARTYVPHLSKNVPAFRVDSIRDLLPCTNMFRRIHGGNISVVSCLKVRTRVSGITLYRHGTCRTSIP
jgi:hypothetical protein